MKYLSNFGTSNDKTSVRYFTLPYLGQGSEILKEDIIAQLVIFYPFLNRMINDHPREQLFHWNFLQIHIRTDFLSFANPLWYINLVVPLVGYLTLVPPFVTYTVGFSSWSTPAFRCVQKLSDMPIHNIKMTKKWLLINQLKCNNNEGN